VGMYVGADAGEASRFATWALATGDPVPVHPVVVLPSGVEGDRVPAAATLLRDTAGTLSEAYSPRGVGMWYLVRPDGHIAAARPGPAAGELGGVLASCVGGAAKTGLPANTSEAAEARVHVTD
jgi:hypothetical protein